ncbi:MAG: type I-E CRISPR-associated protein Cse2/CasB [Anaerolineae bacterium]|jgi:predicted membrane channel-forming protein YqfA (hemolysin III family)|nr:type I-E CRISPR-associated protein Cse2/CasB [Anaerolineae bacterium]
MIKIYLSSFIALIWSVLSLVMIHIVQLTPPPPNVNLLLIGVLIALIGAFFNYQAFRRYDQLTSNERRQQRLQRMVKQLDPQDREILFHQLATDPDIDSLENPMPPEKRKNQG